MDWLGIQVNDGDHDTKVLVDGSKVKEGEGERLQLGGFNLPESEQQ